MEVDEMLGGTGVHFFPVNVARFQCRRESARDYGVEPTLRAVEFVA